MQITALNHHSDKDIFRVNLCRKSCSKFWCCSFRAHYKVGLYFSFIFELGLAMWLALSASGKSQCVIHHIQLPWEAGSMEIWIVMESASLGSLVTLLSRGPQQPKLHSTCSVNECGFKPLRIWCCLLL